jgi:prevent-host-death family protein
METQITATELARSLSDVLNRVKYRGESFVVTRNGEPVATLAPASGEPKETMTWREFIEFLKAHPLPDEDFVRDVMEAKSMQTPPRIPEWDS